MSDFGYVQNSVQEIASRIDPDNICLPRAAVLGVAVGGIVLILVLLISLCCACCGWCCCRRRSSGGVIVTLPGQSTVLNNMHSYPPSEGYSRLPHTTDAQPTPQY